MCGFGWKRFAPVRTFCIALKSEGRLKKKAELYLAGSVDTFLWTVQKDLLNRKAISMYFLRCELDLRASHALVPSQTERCRSSEPWVSANTNGFSFTPFLRSFMRRIRPDLLLYHCFKWLWIVWKLSLSFLVSAWRIIGCIWARHCRFRAALHSLTCMTSSHYHRLNSSWSKPVSSDLFAVQVPWSITDSSM